MFVCLVDKDDSAYNVANSCKRLCFLFFRLCWVYCFYETGTCNYMFFCLVWKNYGTCNLLNIK
ncbi:hypothetical protein HanIR_Chr01g0026641 [Helianthus annuus]|nr:hypothetical protein HanIR_Chr01g0026641 [Helianthus annuus]